MSEAQTGAALNLFEAAPISEKASHFDPRSLRAGRIAVLWEFP